MNRLKCLLGFHSHEIDIEEAIELEKKGIQEGIFTCHYCGHVKWVKMGQSYVSPEEIEK